MKHGKKHKPKRKKKLKTITKPDLGIDERGAHSLSHRPVTQQPGTVEDSATVPEFRQSTIDRTRRKTAGIEIPPEAGEKLSAIQGSGIKDTISDTEAARRAGAEAPDAAQTSDFGLDPDTYVTALVLPADLPAVVNNDIAVLSDIEPEWHQVKHLPGYLRSPIRALGRQIFGTFTDTPIENIQVLAELEGQGPNSPREINAVARWLLKHGVKDNQAVMNFERSIPGYNAEIVVYRARGYTFLLVRDFAGKYIYTWPSSDERAVGESHRTRIDGNG